MRFLSAHASIYDYDALACCQGIKLGKILVHRDINRGEVVYQKLPADIVSLVLSTR